MRNPKRSSDQRKRVTKSQLDRDPVPLRKFAKCRICQRHQRIDHVDELRKDVWLVFHYAGRFRCPGVDRPALTIEGQEVLS